jgi:hypothetical protein
MGVRLPEGIPFGTMYIRKCDKMEHMEKNILIILDRNELVYNSYGLMMTPWESRNMLPQ